MQPLDGPILDIEQLIQDTRTRIIVCCGSGGVGKTTTAAALGLRAAENGRSVCVLTIDPARRLAQAMGLTVLDNTTRAQQILANPFYQALSSSFAGTQEYMAMEKLSQLRAQADRDGTWDLIIVDTPPSRSALDFLDAPERLSSFLDGKFIRILSAPARGAGKGIGRLVGAGVGLFAGVLNKVLGAQLLSDLGTFVAAIDTMFGGFRQRAVETYALLAADGTAFVVVAAPERDALREASYFVDRLAADHMPLAGLVVNRMQNANAEGLSADQARAAAERIEDEDAMVASLLTMHAMRLDEAARQRRLVARFSGAHPSVSLRGVPALAQDVHDLEGLREIGALLGQPT